MSAGQGGTKHEAGRSSSRRSGYRRRTEGADALSRVRRTVMRHSAHAELGSVTAEVAVVLPALVVLLALLLGTAHIGAVQLRLEESARAGAREVMRGESMASVEQTVQRLAGSTATAHVASGEGWTTVEVRALVDGPVVELMGIELSATASGREKHDG